MTTTIEAQLSSTTDQTLDNILVALEYDKKLNHYPGQDLSKYITNIAADRAEIAGMGRPSRSRKTTKIYGVKSVALLRGKSPMQAVTDLEANDNIAPATFRTYRCHINFAFETFLQSGWGSEELIDAHEFLNDIDPKSFEKKKKYGTSNRRKYVEFEELPEILACLLSFNSKYSRISYLLFMLNIHWGLRLEEWETAKLLRHEGRMALRVTNCKNSNGKANGKYRYLYVDKMHKGIDNETVQLLQEYHHLRKTCTKKQLQSGVQRQIRKANKKLFPRRSATTTYYSTRHQFAANFKAYSKHVYKISGELMEIQLAALMGHGSDRTAVRSYGKAGKGYLGKGGFSPDSMAGMFPEPAQANMDAVRNTGAIADAVAYTEASSGPAMGF